MCVSESDAGMMSDVEGVERLQPTSQPTAV